MSCGIQSHREAEAWWVSSRWSRCAHLLHPTPSPRRWLGCSLPLGTASTMGRQKNKVKWHLEGVFELWWYSLKFPSVVKGLQRDSQLQDLVLWATAQVPQNPHVCTSPLLLVYTLPPWRQSHVCSACWKMCSLLATFFPFLRQWGLCRADGTKAAPPRRAGRTVVSVSSHVLTRQGLFALETLCLFFVSVCLASNQNCVKMSIL